jgi:hypothetical protein
MARLGGLGARLLKNGKPEEEGCGAEGRGGGRRVSEHPFDRGDGEVK